MVVGNETRSSEFHQRHASVCSGTCCQIQQAQVCRAGRVGVILVLLIPQRRLIAAILLIV
jgi:hypothetical protein